MARRILEKGQVNDIKLAIAVLHQPISWVLQRHKLYEIVDCLYFTDEQIEDDWVEFTQDMIQKGQFDRFKKHLLKELLYLEAYLEIVELGLDNIKLKTS